MNAGSEFSVAEEEGRPIIVLENPGGALRLELAVGTSRERAEEITEYLNLVIQDVALQPKEDMQPDLERLNAEQPVSRAVRHP